MDNKVHCPRKTGESTTFYHFGECTTKDITPANVKELEQKYDDEMKGSTHCFTITTDSNSDEEVEDKVVGKPSDCVTKREKNKRTAYSTVLPGDPDEANSVYNNGVCCFSLTFGTNNEPTNLESSWQFDAIQCDKPKKSLGRKTRITSIEKCPNTPQEASTVINGKEWTECRDDNDCPGKEICVPGEDKNLKECVPDSDDSGAESIKVAFTVLLVALLI